MADVKISGLPASTLPLAGTEVLPLVQSGVTKKVATDDLTVKNVRSNATTGILQVAGPAIGAIRVMTTPDANFTAARADAAQTLTGLQTIQVASGQPQLKLERTGSLPGSSVMYANQFVSFAVGNGSVDQFFINQSAAAGALEITSDSNLKVLSGKGIDFSATAGTGTSELLNDYEEGTWIPSVGGDATYFNQAGKYTKIGRTVFIEGLMYINVIGTGSINTISGLPFTAGDYGIANFTEFDGIATAVTVLSGITYGTTAVIDMRGLTAAGTNMQPALNTFKNGTYVVFTTTYTV